MALDTYRRKRDFRRTPEPRGRRSKESGHIFVVQKHAARRLHYDFRLELNGVLASWAVPKGPSLDPGEKRLAVHVEDHPLEYGGFEGTIPEGEYGAGRVLLWDRGRWFPEGDPAGGMRKGRLKFRLEGRKLRGRWLLVRMQGRAGGEGKENWLLIKERDEVAAVSSPARDIVNSRPESVASGKSIEEIDGAAGRRGRHSQSKRNKIDPSLVPGARKAPMPGEIRPQLATLVDEAPRGGNWIHEIKFDGYRALCRIENGRATFLTREGKDWTDRFRVLARAAGKLPAGQALLDGEVAMIDVRGTTDFQALQNALREEETDRLVYYAFDLLYWDGYDLTRSRLIDRKEALAAILGSAGNERIRFSDHVVGRGESFYKNACRLGVEGIVSKRKEAPYRSGRGQDWLKVKCFQRQEFVIGGFTDPAGSRPGFGALLLGLYNEKGELVYAGRVGTGFTSRSLLELRERLDRMEEKSPPFSNPPAGPAARGVHWTRPELVAEVAFTGWTREGVLRHPSFQGLGEDKPASAVVEERPLSRAKTAPAYEHHKGEVAGIRLTHPERVLYPEQGITKLELARFYEGIAGWILPHLEKRPLSVIRCPEGHHKECFYQRHADGAFHKSIRRLTIPEKNSEGVYLSVDSATGLVALVQMGALEFHTWGCRSDRIDRPDRLTFDLDPDPSVAWSEVIGGARGLRAVLAELGLVSFVKTTGGKGLHVVVPLARRQSWEEARDFSRAVAETLARGAPDRYTATMSKAKRKGKIFIDYLRNTRGATAVAAYSTRARPGAPVSTPLGWEELRPEIRSDHFNIATLGRRLAELNRDPWEGYEAARRPITAAMKKSLGLE